MKMISFGMSVMRTLPQLRFQENVSKSSCELSIRHSVSRDTIHFGQSEQDPAREMVDMLIDELKEIEKELKVYEKERRAQVKAGDLTLRKKLPKEQAELLPEGALGVDRNGKPVFMDRAEKMYRDNKAEIQAQLEEMRDSLLSLDLDELLEMAGLLAPKPAEKPDDEPKSEE